VPIEALLEFRFVEFLVDEYAGLPLFEAEFDLEQKTCMRGNSNGRNE
jgi:hypothetical protein